MDIWVEMEKLLETGDFILHIPCYTVKLMLLYG